MLDQGTNKGCGLSDDIVAYIYDELSESERTSFETHLVDCTDCTDEFAGISDARFAMFEWHKEEFVPLSTPEMVIPYPAERKAVFAGIFSGIRGLLTLSGWPSAVAVAAGIILAIGLGFVLFDAVRITPQVAEVKPAVSEKPKAATVLEPEEPDAEVAKNAITPKARNTDPEPVPVTAKAADKDLKAVKSVMRDRRPRFAKTLTASTKAMPTPITRKPPALTAFEDEDDNSLRLADLFDEGGS